MIKHNKSIAITSLTTMSKQVHFVKDGIELHGVARDGRDEGETAGTRERQQDLVQHHCGDNHIDKHNYKLIRIGRVVSVQLFEHKTTKQYWTNKYKHAQKKTASKIVSWLQSKCQILTYYIIHI